MTIDAELAKRAKSDEHELSLISTGTLAEMALARGFHNVKIASLVYIGDQTKSLRQSHSKESKKKTHLICMQSRNMNKLNALVNEATSNVHSMQANQTTKEMKSMPQNEISCKNFVRLYQ